MKNFHFIFGQSDCWIRFQNELQAVRFAFDTPSVLRIVDLSGKVIYHEGAVISPDWISSSVNIIEV